MLSNALALAIATTIGIGVIYAKLPRKVRRVIEKYSLLTDMIALILVYILLGGTLTALMAGALCGLFTSVFLYIQQHQTDFLFLWDMSEWIKEQLAVAKQTLTEYGRMYRERREAEKTVIN